MALTRDRARESVERGFAKAQALGFKVAIAVVDDAGHLVVETASGTRRVAAGDVVHLRPTEAERGGYPGAGLT